MIAIAISRNFIHILNWEITLSNITFIKKHILSIYANKLFKLTICVVHKCKVFTKLHETGCWVRFSKGMWLYFFNEYNHVWWFIIYRRKLFRFYFQISINIFCLILAIPKHFKCISQDGPLCDAYKLSWLRCGTAHGEYIGVSQWLKCGCKLLNMVIQ